MNKALLFFFNGDLRKRGTSDGWFGAHLWQRGLFECFVLIRDRVLLFFFVGGGGGYFCFVFHRTSRSASTVTRHQVSSRLGARLMNEPVP